MVYENYLTYTVGGADTGRLSITKNRITLTDLQVDEEVYVYKDRGIGNITDLQHLCSVKQTNAVQKGGSAFWAISNGSHTLTALTTNDDGIAVWKWYNTDDAQKIKVRDFTNDNEDTSIDLVNNQQYWVTITRIGTAMTVMIYDDSDRTSLIDTLSIICTAIGFRYQHVQASDNEPLNGADFDGFIENHDFGAPLPMSLSLTLALKGSVGRPPLGTGGTSFGG